VELILRTGVGGFLSCRDDVIVLLTLAWVGIASLGPVLRAEAQAARIAGTGVPRNTVTATLVIDRLALLRCSFG